MNDAIAVIRNWLTTYRSEFRIVTACITAGLVAFAVSRLSLTSWAQLATYVYLAAFSLGVLVFGAFAGRRALIAGLSSLLVVPCFVRLGGGSLIGMPETSSARLGGQTVPVGAILCLIVFIRLSLRGLRRADRPTDRSVLDTFMVLFVITAGLGVVYGWLRWQNPFTLLYGAQTVAPLTAYFVARDLLIDESDVRRFWTWTVASAGIFAALLLANELSMRPVSALFDEAIHGKIGVLNIYQANDYLPFLWALVVTITLPLMIDRETRNLTFLLALVPITLCVGALYARGALLLLIFGFIAVFVTSPQLWSSRRRLLTVAAGGLLVTAAFATSPAGVRLLERASVLSRGDQIDTVVTGESSLRDRVFSMRVVANYVGGSPIFGAAFTPVPSQDLSRSIASLSRRQLFPAHNQYLDIALRGGFLLLATFLMIIGIALHRTHLAWARARTTFERQLTHGITIALLLTLVLGNMYEQNHVQPFTAFFLWFLVGAPEVVLRSNRPVAEGDRSK